MLSISSNGVTPEERTTWSDLGKSLRPVVNMLSLFYLHFGK